MRRTCWIGLAVAGLALAGTLFFLPPRSSTAEPEKPEKVGTVNHPLLPAAASVPIPPVILPSQLAPAATPLPITRVVLFSSGVGYFQREGQVQGTTRIDLAFPVQDINDLLKSLVLQDLNGGQISAVSYDSQDPMAKTLQSFAINLNDNPPLAQILGQARGEKVEVVMQPGTAVPQGTLTGTVVGLEKQRLPAGKDGAVEVDVLNLWCAEGLGSVRLPEVQLLHFLNPLLDNEFQRALNVLASGHDTQKKMVSLSFSGEGKRQVRVGYVVEHPVWKTSYRLVLDDKSKPFLQGWGIVENPSDQDWTNVGLTLVSGRPISFQMDLYQPLYIHRPVEKLELFASLQPTTYGGAMGGPAAPPPAPSMATFAPGAPMAARAAMRRGAEADGKQAEAPLNLQQGVASAATAVELGDFFQYAITNPVNLPRQKSAQIPLLNQGVEGAKVSIYNQGTLAKFPLLGLKLKNTTGLHLMQGPITIYEDSSYAGDAMVSDLEPNEERLLSYAIDLGTEVEPVAKRAPDRLVALKIDKGILSSTSKIRDVRTYGVKNRSDQDRTLIIEHPFRPDFKLVSQVQPAERSRDLYRFELKVPAGKSASLEVAEEQDQVQTVALTNSDSQAMGFFLTTNVGSDKVKEALKRAIDLKDRWAATQHQREEADKQLAALVNDQGRVRADLKEVPPTSDLYKRYLDKLNNQETEIEKLQAQVKQLQEAEGQQRKSYEEYLSSLNVE